MYVGEFLLWFGNAMKSETRKKLKMGYINADMTLKEVQKDYTQESVSDNPRPLGPYYAYNDRYLEIRGGMFENFRGILAWISLLIFMIPVSSAYNSIYCFVLFYCIIIKQIKLLVIQQLLHFLHLYF